MKRLFHSVVFLCWGLGLAVAQDLALPVVKSGIWHIYNGKDEIKLPDTYSFVSLFDEGGTAFFYQGQNYGVIDRNGTELIPARFTSIASFGNSCYRYFANDSLRIIKVNAKGNTEITCQKAEKIQSNWVAYEQHQQKKLLNTVNLKRIELNDSSLQVQVLFDDYIVLTIDTNTRILLDKMGNEVFRGKARMVIYAMYAVFEAENMHFICDAYGVWHFPKGAEFVSISSNRIHYKFNRIAHLLERDSKKELFAYPCDELREFESGNYLFYINSKMGVLSPDKKVLLDAKYSNIAISTEFIYVYFNGVMGLHDQKYREILPCKFTNITYDKQFFYTASVGETHGLISRITGKEILACNYDKILFENLLVKAWFGSTLSIIELTDQHVVKNKLVLENTISLRKLSPRPGKNYWIDKRLMPLGWFYDTVPQLNPKTKQWIGTTYKWGLKNGNDSILIRPGLKQPIYIPNAPVSLVPNGKTKFEYLDGDKNDTPIFKLVDYSTGKSYNDLQVFTIDTMDFMTRNYARLGHVDGVSIIKSDGTLSRITYVDYTDEKYLRFCIAESYQLEKKAGAETTPIPTYFFNQRFYPQSVTVQKVEYHALKYLQASWNFFDENGDSLFKESFEYAQPFYKNTAIVKRKTGWGVVSKDSLVIPAKFSSIERIRFYQDTVFLVRLGQKGDLYLDTNLRIISSNTDEMVDKKGDLMLYVHKDKKYICNTSLKKISPDYSNVRLHAFNRYVTKEKKEFLIFNEQGSGIGSVASKPEDFISPDFFTVESKGKIGLMSIQEDTVVPFQFKEIVAQGSYFLAKNNLHHALYDQDGSKLAEVEAGKILVDSLSGYWAIQQETKISVFNDKGVRVAKLKSDLIFDHFYNKCLLASKSNFSRMNLDGSRVISSEKFTEIEAFPGGYVALENENHIMYLYDLNWKKVGDSVQVKNIEYHGDDVFSFNGKKGNFLIDVKHNEKLDEVLVDGDFQQNFVKISGTSRSYNYSFVDRDFKLAFGRKFMYAKQFRAGFAPIQDVHGWTIINKQGIQKSYPGFEEITAISDMLFKAKKKVLFGIIDSQGKTIIEPIYEKITFIENKYIQVIKEGEIGYFDLTGKRVY